MQSRDTYKEVKVFKYPNATVRVHIPDIADDERQRREKELKQATEMLLREVIKNEYNTRNTNGS